MITSTAAQYADSTAAALSSAPIELIASNAFPDPIKSSDSVESATDGHPDITHPGITCPDGIHEPAGCDAGAVPDLPFQPMLDVPDPATMAPLDQLAAVMGDRTLTPKRFGLFGEQYAARWLESQGWTVLSRNWHTRYGELDVVALAPGRVIVFVEVKARRNARYGPPQEAVTPTKQRNLRRAACDWLIDRRNRMPHAGIRFDVITIVMHAGRPQVLHIPNAF